ncbi:MAG: IS200/IS605 family transposase [Lyngbya sp.]|nr:IS200/IS605 family transposase [Lyngbya sp.]
MTTHYRKGAHSVFSIQLHSYFVTAYRRKCLTTPMIDRINDIAARVLLKNDCILLECFGESDHVHFLFDLHPKNNVSTLLGSMKSATSRIIRREFEPELKPYFKNWKKGLWGDQLYIRSAGGAPLKILEEYIQSHSRG